MWQELLWRLEGVVRKGDEETFHPAWHAFQAWAWIRQWRREGASVGRNFRNQGTKTGGHSHVGKQCKHRVLHFPYSPGLSVEVKVGSLDIRLDSGNIRKRVACTFLQISDSVLKTRDLEPGSDWRALFWSLPHEYSEIPLTNPCLRKEVALPVQQQGSLGQNRVCPGCWPLGNPA